MLPPGVTRVRRGILSIVSMFSLNSHFCLFLSLYPRILNLYLADFILRILRIMGCLLAGVRNVLPRIFGGPALFLRQRQVLVLRECYWDGNYGGENLG